MNKTILVSHTAIGFYGECKSLSVEDLFTTGRGFITSLSAGERVMNRALEKISDDDLSRWDSSDEEHARNCFKGDWFEVFALFFLRYYEGLGVINVKDAKQWPSVDTGCDIEGRTLDDKSRVYIQVKYRGMYKNEDGIMVYPSGIYLTNTNDKVGRLVEVMNEEEYGNRPLHESKGMVFTNCAGLNHTTAEHRRKTISGKLNRTIINKIINDGHEKIANQAFGKSLYESIKYSLKG